MTGKVSLKKEEMPSNLVIARELSQKFKLIAHPDRIRLIEELRKGEKDVNSLAEVLDLPGTRVSQHLSLMRAHRIVQERRDGRHNYYQIIQPEIAGWIVDGLDFIKRQMSGNGRPELKMAYPPAASAGNSVLTTAYRRD